MSKENVSILPHALSPSLPFISIYYNRRFPHHSIHITSLFFGGSKCHIVDHLNLLLVGILETGGNRTARLPTSVDGNLGLVMFSLLKRGDESRLNIGPCTVVKRLQQREEN